MKRITFKTELKSKEDALNKIPNFLKEDQKVFELTDGNKTYKVRWEGTLSEGSGVALKGKDEKIIKEDINRMKELWGYKSKDTLGSVKGSDRVDENKKFIELLKPKKLIDGKK